MPSTIYLVTGGCRSGKSSYAQKLAETLCPNPIYLATSEASGSYQNVDMDERIIRHQKERGENWTTIEAPLYPSEYLKEFESRVVLVDCLTLWLTNHMLFAKAFSLDGIEVAAEQRREAAEAAFTSMKEDLQKLTNQWNTTYIFVTNEIGSGTHASDAFSRTFVDYQGWLNQYVASKADKVIHMVSGCPNIVKEFKDARRDATVSEEDAEEARMLDKFLSSRGLDMDPKGYFLVKLKDSRIFASFHSCMKNDKGELCDLNGNKLSCHGKSPEPMKTWAARTAKEITRFIFEDWKEASQVVSVGHAAYIGREVQKAEHCLYCNLPFQQD